MVRSFADRRDTESALCPSHMGRAMIGDFPSRVDLEIDGNFDSHYRMSVLRDKRELIKLLNPHDVCAAIETNETIVSWLKVFSKYYLPPKAAVHLIYPCASTKPFANAQSYKQLQKTLKSLSGKRDLVHVYTISEPFGLIPEEFAEDVPTYDCPGIFSWWCSRQGQPDEPRFVERAIRELSLHTAPILERMEGCVIAAIRTYSSGLQRKRDHTHFRILDLASQLSGRAIDFFPPKEIVSDVVTARGRFAWDRYGPAHPLVQEKLKGKLMEVVALD